MSVARGDGRVRSGLLGAWPVEVGALSGHVARGAVPPAEICLVCSVT